MSAVIKAQTEPNPKSLTDRLSDCHDTVHQAQAIIRTVTVAHSSTAHASTDRDCWAVCLSLDAAFDLLEKVASQLDALSIEVVRE